MLIEKGTGRSATVTITPIMIIADWIYFIMEGADGTQIPCGVVRMERQDYKGLFLTGNGKAERPAAQEGVRPSKQ